MNRNYIINRNIIQHSAIIEDRINLLHEFDWNVITFIKTRKEHYKNLISKMIHIHMSKNKSKI